MTDDEKIETIIHSLTTHALGDIQRASSGDSKMGAFILCSCLIDAISGFEIGKDTTRTDYMDFVTRRLSSYDGTKIYKDLRCKLVHSYSEGGSYVFVDNQPSLHMTSLDSKTKINLENFISDITSALQAFADDIRGLDPRLRVNAISRFDDNGVIRVINSPLPSLQEGSTMSDSTSGNFPS